jgi:transposase-like protein
MARGGNNLTLRKARIDAIAKALEMGLPRKEACRAVKISPSTFFAWIKIAREIIEKQENGVEVEMTRSRKLYLLLHERVEEAEAKFLSGCLARIHKIGARTDKWQAFAWLLERRRPKEFGRSIKITDGNEADNSRVNDPADVVREMMRRTVGVEEASDSSGANGASGGV